MSVIGYFTTSPVVLMRRWEPELTPLCEVCNNWLAENDSFSSTTVFYYLCDGECTQSSFVLQILKRIINKFLDITSSGNTIVLLLKRSS